MDKIIKFRAMTLNGQWVYGLLSYIPTKKGWYISNLAGVPYAYHVRPESVGQFIGLIRDGKEFYEGDIVKWNSWAEGHNDNWKTGQIIWDNRKLAFRIKENWADFSPAIYSRIQVIGNIYENPELIKKELKL